MWDASSCGKSESRVAWNVLTDRWLEVMNLDGEPVLCSAMEALERASGIRCIAVGSPLDLFAAHRFLLALLYWKADVAGGVPQLRESLLRGEMPQVVLDAIEAEASSFRLFDGKAPFLQDPSARNEKKPYSAGSLFAEFASGTNIAHFHHGDDGGMRICLRCATIGMLRVIPWSQAGGSGVTPAIHGAPPIVAIASGKSLAITLGLNLIALPGEAGAVRWSGRFSPTDKEAPIPYLEAFTWNPRRVHLLSPQTADCWRCGRRSIPAVGPIRYLRNENTKTEKGEGRKTIPFAWQDPSAFYRADAQYTTMKSRNEALATGGGDPRVLLDREGAAHAKTAVAEANPGHEGWHLIIPCTNPANNKTFDHRQLDLPTLSQDSVRPKLPADVPSPRPQGLDGWTEPRPDSRDAGPRQFVRAAARLLTHADWVALSAAAYKEMHDSPAAFDLLCGLLWPLRKKVRGLPRRHVAWLVLKLMAAVPFRARVPHARAGFCPLRFLPKRQLAQRRSNRSGPAPSPYPVSFPRGRRLEAVLRAILDSNMRKRAPEPIDWAGLCQGLGRLLD